MRAVDKDLSAPGLSAEPTAPPPRHTRAARTPAERSRWHVVAPFARYDRSGGFTKLLPTSTIHAKEMGTLTTACGLRSGSWFTFWAEDFPMPRTDVCQECWHIAHATARR